ncbi:aspartic peptidase domain-containing protein [Nemania diffusa]|nr:aspartic peptidase domain-containing protein [Nemania diffusa]
MGLGHGQGNGFINYPLVVDSLAAQKVTNTKLFSMDLGRQTNPGAVITGELVFGGVDRNKYAGFLKKVPADPKDAHYKITLNSLAHRAPGAGSTSRFVDSNLPLPVIVDSGTTLSLLPESVVSKLAAQFPGAVSDGNGGYRVDCAYQDRDGSVDFGFLSGTETVTINVAYKDFIWNSGGDCFLGAWHSNELDVWILGDAFLRGAYVTFDQTNNALFMSNQVSCGDGQSKLAPVPAGPDAAGKIPGACRVVAAPHDEPPSTSTSSAPFPDGSISAGDVPSPSLGPSLNPIEPTDLKTLTIAINPSPSSPVASTIPPAESGASMTTVTGTVTRAVVYTITACPDSVPDCPARNQVVTRFETIKTAAQKPIITTAAAPAPSSAHPPALVTESSAPAGTPLTRIPYTRPWNSDAGEGGEEEEGGEGQEQRQQMMMTTAYAATTTYAVTSCNPAAASCTIGMTTTRAFTVVKTIRVQPRPTTTTSSSSPPPSANSRNTTWTTAQNPVVVGAAGHSVDDGQVDRRYLGAVFVFVCGLMVLL